jgi:hypothetical protein
MERFYRWRRNPRGPNPKPPNLISPLYHISTYLSNLKTYGHYTSQTLVCQVFCIQNMPKKASDFLRKDLNTFKKPYKLL